MGSKCGGNSSIGAVPLKYKKKKDHSDPFSKVFSVFKLY